MNDYNLKLYIQLSSVKNPNFNLENRVELARAEYLNLMQIVPKYKKYI